MSELDDLRRVAYGRTNTADDEAAAAEARAALARLDEQPQPSRADEEATAPEHTEDDERVTLTIVDTHGEPGYLRRLLTTWRVWAVPAFAAFVVGIVLTVASGLVLLQASRTGPAELVKSGEVVQGQQPGDLEKASALLASPQSDQDLLAVPMDSLDASTTHALTTPSGYLVYAAMSTDGNICLIIVTDAAGYSTCTPPSGFANGGVWAGTTTDGVNLKLWWDGVKVTESRTLF